MVDEVYGLEKVNPTMEEVQNAVKDILASVPDELKDCPVEVELIERSICCDGKTMQVCVQPGRASIRFLPKRAGRNNE